MNNYSVYCHTFPDGRNYVGITSMLPHLRWMEGDGYCSSPRMYETIKEMGWKNIVSQVLVRKMYEKDARDLEAVLIQKLESYKEEKGTNTLSGEDRIRKRKLDVDKILEKYGLSDFNPQPIKNGMEVVRLWKIEEEKRLKELELRRIAREQIANWTESLSNPLPIYEDEEYKEILEDELRIYHEKNKMIEEKRKKNAKAYHEGAFKESEIDAYEREKWQRISRQKATYQKWRGNK